MLSVLKPLLELARTQDRCIVLKQFICTNPELSRSSNIEAALQGELNTELRVEKSKAETLG